MTASHTINRFVKPLADAIRIFLLALACLAGCPIGRAEKPDLGELDQVREFIQSVPDERLLELFRSGINDRHGRSDIFYQELIRRDSRGFVKNEILGLVRERKSPSNSSRLMLPGQQMPAYLAAKYFGHEPDFRAALLQLIVDTNVWAKTHDHDYGTTLLKRSSTIGLLLSALAKNENLGALQTVLAIGQRGQLVPGSRLTFYLSLAERYNAFESEREEILRALAVYLLEEPDGEVLAKLNENPNFKIVQVALEKRELVARMSSAENKANGGNIPVSGPVQQKGSASKGEEKSGNGHPLLWPGLFLALGLAALLAAFLFIYSKRTT